MPEGDLSCRRLGRTRGAREPSSSPVAPVSAGPMSSVHWASGGSFFILLLIPELFCGFEGPARERSRPIDDLDPHGVDDLKRQSCGCPRLRDRHLPRSELIQGLEKPVTKSFHRPFIFIHVFPVPSPHQPRYPHLPLSLRLGALVRAVLMLHRIGPESLRLMPLYVPSMRTQCCGCPD